MKLIVLISTSVVALLALNSLKTKTLGETFIKDWDQMKLNGKVKTIEEMNFVVSYEQNDTILEQKFVTDDYHIGWYTRCSNKYYFTKKGLLKKDKSIYYRDKHKTENTYHYNSKGLLTMIVDETSQKQVYTYDAKDRIIKIRNVQNAYFETFNYGDKIEEKIRYSLMKRDPLGNNHEFYQSKKTVTVKYSDHKSVEYSYIRNQRYPLDTIVFELKDSITKKYENGLLSAVIFHDNQPGSTSNKKYAYNSYGHLKRFKSTHNHIYSFVYKYDPQQNWVRRSIFRNDTLRAISKRKIEYW